MCRFKPPVIPWPKKPNGKVLIGDLSREEIENRIEMAEAAIKKQWPPVPYSRKELHALISSEGRAPGFFPSSTFYAVLNHDLGDLKNAEMLWFMEQILREMGLAYVQPPELADYPTEDAGYYPQKGLKNTLELAEEKPASKRKKPKDFVKAGLIAIWDESPVDNINREIRKAKHSICIVDSNLPGVEDLIRAMVKSISAGSPSIKILLMHPYGHSARLRAAGIGIDYQSFQRQIKRTLISLAKTGVLRGKIELRLFDAHHDSPMYFIDEKAYIGQFGYGEESGIQEVREYYGTDTPFFRNQFRRWEALWAVGEPFPLPEIGQAEDLKWELNRTLTSMQIFEDNAPSYLVPMTRSTHPLDEPTCTYQAFYMEEGFRVSRFFLKVNALTRQVLLYENGKDGDFTGSMEHSGNGVVISVKTRSNGGQIRAQRIANIDLCTGDFPLETRDITLGTYQRETNARGLPDLGLILLHRIHDEHPALDIHHPIPLEYEEFLRGSKNNLICLDSFRVNDLGTLRNILNDQRPHWEDKLQTERDILGDYEFFSYDSTRKTILRGLFSLQSNGKASFKTKGNHTYSGNYRLMDQEFLYLVNKTTPGRMARYVHFIPLPQSLSRGKVIEGNYTGINHSNQLVNGKIIVRRLGRQCFKAEKARHIRYDSPEASQLIRNLISSTEEFNPDDTPLSPKHGMEVLKHWFALPVSEPISHNYLGNFEGYYLTTNQDQLIKSLVEILPGGKVRLKHPDGYILQGMAFRNHTGLILMINRTNEQWHSTYQFYCPDQFVYQMKGVLNKNTSFGRPSGRRALLLRTEKTIEEGTPVRIPISKVGEDEFLSDRPELANWITSKDGIVLM